MNRVEMIAITGHTAKEWPATDPVFKQGVKVVSEDKIPEGSVLICSYPWEPRRQVDSMNEWNCHLNRSRSFHDGD